MDLAVTSQQATSSSVLSPVGIWSVGFCGGRKTGELKKALGARTRTNNNLDPHATPGLGIEPGLQR